jgi:DNA-binding MarR family transcriptional regulator
MKNRTSFIIAHRLSTIRDADMILVKTTVMLVVKRLLNKYLVERIRSDEDRRVVYASVTEDAKHKFKECFDKTEKLLEGMMMKKATKEEIDLILSGLNTLKQVLDRQ